MQQNLKIAYVIHRRPYRNTSFLLDVFTREQGRMSVVAKGANRNQSSLASLLQPFRYLLVSWYGKRELVTLTHAESLSHHIVPLSGMMMLAGLYLNELLVRLLPQQDASAALFDGYHETISKLINGHPDGVEVLLRKFEKILLRELGFALQLSHELQTHFPVQSDAYYSFSLEGGVKRVDTCMAPPIFSGKSLLALHADDFSEQGILKDAKSILRIAIGSLLSGRPLKTRELFLQYAANK